MITITQTEIQTLRASDLPDNPADKGDASSKDDPSTKSFVLEWDLRGKGWESFGDLSDRFGNRCQFETSVPWVHPGKQVIIWKTWHLTCGGNPHEFKSSNMAGFVDCVDANSYCQSK